MLYCVQRRCLDKRRRARKVIFDILAPLIKAAAAQTEKGFPSALCFSLSLEKETRMYNCYLIGLRDALVALKEKKNRVVSSFLSLCFSDRCCCCWDSAQDTWWWILLLAGVHSDTASLISPCAAPIKNKSESSKCASFPKKKKKMFKKGSAKRDKTPKRAIKSAPLCCRPGPKTHTVPKRHGLYTTTTNPSNREREKRGRRPTTIEFESHTERRKKKKSLSSWQSSFLVVPWCRYRHGFYSVWETA